MIINNRFVYCLTINDNRYNYTCQVFEKYGLTKPNKYYGIKCEEKKERCCLFGHMSIVLMARFLNFPYVFIYEDDAYPRKDIKLKLDYYLCNKPEDCGILVLGRNGEAGLIEKYNNYHIVKERPFGAHSYVVFQNCYDDLLKSFEKEKISDIALKGNNFNNYKPYWVNENLFIQKNLDDECMSKNLVKKYGKYFYPKEDGGLGVFDDVPNNNWE